MPQSNNTEFDKQLELAFYSYLGGMPDKDEMEDFNEFRESIKQLVSTHIIGEDIDIPSEMEKVGRDFEKLNNIALVGGIFNNQKLEQRKALGLHKGDSK